MKDSVKTSLKKAKNKNNSQSNWPVAYRWAAMGTLVAYSAAGTETFNVARAQDVIRSNPSNGSISETQGSQPVWRFDIPAGSLESVIPAFQQVTGLSVSVAKEGLRSLLRQVYRACTPPSKHFRSYWPMRV